MALREDSLNEFESIFERASIPVLEIREVQLARIDAILFGHALDASVIELSQALARRFGAELTYHGHTSDGAAPPRAPEGSTVVAFDAIEGLIGRLSLSATQLVVTSDGEPDESAPVPPEVLVENLAAPVLLTRCTVEDGDGVFRRILHSLTGNFQQTRNFEYSFSLVDDAGGELMLLHTIDQDEIEDVRDALQVTVDIPDPQRDELLAQLARHGERYLKGIVAASRQQPYDVRYRLEVGEVIEAVQAEIRQGQYGLLVIGCHREGRSHISSADYQLMESITQTPVLAL